jgi:predicted transcriptional regulator
MPENIPNKLVINKMRQLIRRGIVTGCGCGCRGDFEITPKGEELLKTWSHSSTE